MSIFRVWFDGTSGADCDFELADCHLHAAEQFVQRRYIALGKLLDPGISVAVCVTEEYGSVASQRRYAVECKLEPRYSATPLERK